MREEHAEVNNPGVYRFTWLLASIICWGTVLRLAQYLFNRSLWLDESMLALNIVNKDFYQLMGRLDYNQMTPLGFLMLERSAVQLFGSSEYSLRLFPLICGIISLFLFYDLAKRTVAPKAVPIGVGLFALSAPLIYYSSEVKQYSTDVAMAILLYSAAVYFRSCPLTPWRLSIFGALGASSIWFSHASVFMLVGIGMALAFTCLIERRWARIGMLSITYVFWAMSLAACYFISLRHLPRTKGLFDYWTFAFVPHPILSASAMEWFVGTFFEIFENPAGFELPGLASFAFLCGCISLLSNKRVSFLILMSPPLLTLMAAGFHQYPFRGRLILFLVPALLLVIAEGTEFIRSKIMAEAHLIASCLIGLLFFYPVLNSTYHLIKPKMREEIKPIMRYIKEHRHEDDVLYVYHGAEPAFRFYAASFGLDTMQLVAATRWEDGWDKYETTVDLLRSHGRVWLLFSHSRPLAGQDEENVFRYFLDKRARKLDYFKSKGVAVYLYNFEEPVSLNRGTVP